jgi:hypothetical protein
MSASVESMRPGEADATVFNRVGGTARLFRPFK